MPDDPIMTPVEKFGYFIKLALIIILLVALVLVGFYVLSAVLSGVGGLAGDFFQKIQDLFRHAPDFLKNKRGFSSFIQLILIAIFIGWAIKRIMRYMGRK
jgi:hypothetical protein